LFARHRTPERWWSENATIEDWFDEMVGMANIVNRFGGVAMEDLRGEQTSMRLHSRYVIGVDLTSGKSDRI
jgi:hypothetical protein